VSNKTKCPNCGEFYKELGSHWQWNPDHRPKLTQYQKDVITGLLMGDGWVGRSSKNPKIMCEMISKNYLEYIDDVFGCLSTGVKLKLTAGENAAKSRDSGFSSDADAENYSDLYYLHSRSHPELKEFADWYSTGKKVWPKDIELTPTVLKHWYCGDGTWQNTGGSYYIRFSMSNEIDNTNKVDNMFERCNLPSPNSYSVFNRGGEYIDCDALFTVKQSKKLWKYMGKPLPDFEYKWPESYR
jgi:hypothetical protein